MEKTHASVKMERTFRSIQYVIILFRMLFIPKNHIQIRISMYTDIESLALR